MTENINTPVGDIPVEELAKMAADSEREFTNEMNVTPKAAIGTEQAAADNAAHIDFDFGSPGNAGEGTGSQEDGPQIFPDDDIPGADAAKAQFAGMTIDEMLEVRFAFEGMLLAEMAGDGDNSAAYMPTEAEKVLYRAVYAPYRDVAAEKLPPWLWIVMIEAVFTGKRFIRALKSRKVNKANKKEAETTPVSMAGAVSKSVPFPAPPGAIKGERTNFKIFADGSYHFCRQTATQKAVYKAQGTHPVEKVDLSNTEHVKQVISANGWPKLQRAFGLPDNWPETKGIDIENLGIDE